jgi:hypothetical protein
MGISPQHFAEPGCILNRTRPDHQTLDANLQPRSNRRFVTNTAAEFTRNVDGFEQLLDGNAVDDLSVARSIEIDQVETIGTRINPPLCHRHGIRAEYRLALIVALLKPNTLTAANVNRWPNLHEIPPFLYKRPPKAAISHRKRAEAREARTDGSGAARWWLSQETSTNLGTTWRESTA